MTYTIKRITKTRVCKEEGARRKEKQGRRRNKKEVKRRKEQQ